MGVSGLFSIDILNADIALTFTVHLLPLLGRKLIVRLGGCALTLPICRLGVQPHLICFAAKGLGDPKEVTGITHVVGVPNNQAPNIVNRFSGWFAAHFSQLDP